MPMIHKACPVALHPDGAPRRVPVFAHPLAGLQLVKGTVHAGEDPTRAAARELFEESGLETRAAIPMGHSDDIVTAERWHFALCRIAPPVRDRWQHLCQDDGGHLFKFHWIELDAPSDLPAPFAAALDWMRGHL